MGQGESSHNDTERLFDVLDKDKSGDLSMNELLSIQELPGLNLPFTNSPLILFKYNEAEDGKISKEDFARLVSFFKEESKKLQKRFAEHVSSANAGAEHEKEKEKLLGLFPRRNTLKRSQSRNDVTAGVRTCIDVNKDELHVSRDSSTPMLTGRVRPEEALEEHAREKEALEEMLHEPPVDTRKLVKKILCDEEGQQKFLAWLFRFADVEHKEVISVSQLSKLLKVLAKDGINVATLCYDHEQSPASPQAAEHLEDDPAYAQHLLEEYDIGHTGYLTRDEFLKLGDLILRQYATESSNEHDMLKNYVLGRKLGVGASGVVRLAVHRDSHARKAVKIIHRGDVTDMSRLDTEIKAMLLLRHPRVVQLDEVLEDSERIYFVMELCGGGSLADIVAEKPLDERLARFYFAELVEGVAYCHAQGVCHRDLKLENLLCNNLGHLKITDFGHAGIFQKGWDIFQTGLVGTLWHLAPEQIAGQAYSGERVDVWAMGVALYRMLSGDPPFLSSNPVEFLESVKAVKWTRPVSFSPDAIAFLERIFVAQPDQRISLDEMRDHQWLNKGERRAPEFLRKQLWIGKWADIEVPWHLMLDIVHDLHIFACTVAPEGENVTALRKMIKCQVPEKDLKFSISFKNKRTENPFFHFKLREGEAEVFHDLCAQISAEFEKKMADQRLHEAKEQRSSMLGGDPELSLNELVIDDYNPRGGGETTPRGRMPSRPGSPVVLQHSHSNSVLDHRDK